VCSGIRFGSPCATSRGMGEREMEAIAALVDRLLGGEDPARVLPEVEALAAEFPIP
jgi:glycine hydroxymethyltransferase